MEPYATFHAGRVRVVSEPAEYRLLVQVKHRDEWRTVSSYCVISNGYAWTQAQAEATRLAHG